MKKQILVNGFAINRSKIERDVIDNKECVILHDVKSIKQDSVMNGMLYKADIVANTYQQLNDVLAPYSHPKKPSGELLASTDWMAINNFHVGAKNVNARLQDDGWVVNDIIIDVEYASNSERGRDLLNRIERIEAGEDIQLETSTGLYYSAANEQGEENGRKYSRVVTAMAFEHNALLDSDETAAGLGCGFTANNEAVEQVSLMDAIDSRKPSLFSKVKCYFGGNKLTIEDVYNQLSTLVNGDITAVYNSHIVVNDSVVKYAINNDTITLLPTHEMESKMDETQIKALLSEQAETIMAANAQAVTAAVEPLTAKIAELETELAANADKELSAKREAVKAKFGLTDEAVKDMGVNALDAMYAQTAAATAITGNSVDAPVTDSLLDMMPAE